MDEKIEEDVKKKRKDKWFDVWFAIEALAKEEEIVKSALEKHVEKLQTMEGLLVYDKKVRGAESVENPIKGVDKAFSQVIEVKLMIRDLFVLLSTVMLFGPSAIEVMGPDKKEIRIDEVQNIANQISGVVHQFASAGIGGIVITPDPSKGK